MFCQQQMVSTERVEREALVDPTEEVKGARTNFLLKISFA